MRNRFAALVTLLSILLLTTQAVVAAPRADPAAPTQAHRLYLPAMRQNDFPADAAAKKKPMPPQSRAFGKSLDEWLFLYWHSNFTTGPGAQVGNVLFLPLPDPASSEPGPGGTTIFVGHLPVTLKPGTAFVLPVLAYGGESYVGDEPPDDEPKSEDVFTTMTLQVTLDGDSLIDNRVDKLDPYYFGPKSFDPPIVYDEPQPRNDEGTVLADALIWIQGVGFVYPPLSVGSHTLELYVVNEALGFGYHNTWTIQVQP